MMIRTLSISSLLLSLCSAMCFAADMAPQESVKKVVLDSTQIFTIYSNANKQNYRLQVSLPGSYQTNLAKKYPIIIKVDGQWDFPLAASVFNNIYFDGQMPETIVMGIDWADVTGNIHAIRARDLLPYANSSFENSGHAKEFTSVLAKEIIPALNQRYRLNGQAFLLGGSWGATFVTYALLERPDVFDGAVAIAGDYESGTEVFDKQLKALANTKNLEGKRLYIGVGKGDSVVADVLAYADKLKAANFTGFNVKVDALEGFGHSGMNVPGYASGYKYMFERPQLTVAADELAKFVGIYKSTEKGATDIVVQQEGQSLKALMDGDAISLMAKSATEFYNAGSFFNLIFEDSKLKLETFFGETNYVKAKSGTR